MKITRKPYAELLRDSLLHVRPRLEVEQDDETGSATVRIFGVIDEFWGISAGQVAEALDEIDSDEIEVLLNSIGGSVFEGVAIYNLLRNHKARITVKVMGMAASIASVILQAGDERIMLSGSQAMIHPAWGITIGDASDHRETADILDKQTDIVASIYAERVGGSGKKAHFSKLMQAESWFTAEEAVAEGLADKVVKPTKQEKTQDRLPQRFVERAESVVTDVEQLIEETEKVVTFRSSQGKPPLSEDSVELLDRLAAAVRALEGVVTPDSEPSPEPREATQDEAGAEYARFVSLTLQP